jgi:sugar lactone lactonase YvrE
MAAILRIVLWMVSIRRWFVLPLAACAAPPPVPASTAPVSSAPASPDPATRLDQLRAELRDRPSGAALYAAAHYAAKLGRRDEALDALRRLDAIGWDGGLADDQFPEIAALPEYRALAAKLGARSPVAHKSVAGFAIAEAGLHAEGIAYDAERATFYVGSTTQGRIVAVDSTGRARDVARTGLREVLGLKVGRDHTLWAACNDDERPDGDSCVLALDPASGAVLRRACVRGPGHEANDLAVAADGTVFVTDPATGAVLRLAPGATTLETFLIIGRGANGIALGPGDRVLLVAYGRGIARVDLATGATTQVEHAPSAAFVGIDGMSLRGSSLYAIANSYGRPRVVRVDLDADLARVERFETLEANHAEWDEPTTGALGPDGFYYIADSQMNSGAAPRPTIVLKIPFPTEPGSAAR